MDPPASISTSERTLRGALLLAGAGSLLLLVNLLGTPGRLVALAAMIVGAVISAPYPSRGGEPAGRGGEPAGRWWTALAAGTLIALAGVLIGLAIESLGGLLTVAGSALAASAVALGYPGR